MAPDASGARRVSGRHVAARTSAGVPVPPPRPPRRVMWLAGTLLALLLVDGLVHAHWATPGASVMPAELLGTWVTDDARYTGRALELRPRAVVFQRGSVAPDVLSVVAVRTDGARGGRAAYTITAIDDGQPAAVSLSFDRGPPSELRLSSQPSVRWRRAPGMP